MTQKRSDSPFFSIGVTTYRRPEMLSECLRSLLAQSFSDFEVIVGNDYVKEPVTLESLGISDDRVRVVNHSTNLGEVANMNTLLRLSSGKYFTWLADDDMVAPAFLSAVYRCLEQNRSLKCVYTTFFHGTSFHNRIQQYDDAVELMEGRRFLRRYLTREIRLQGCYGVFARGYMLAEGGMRGMGPNRSSFYADPLLAIRAGLLDQIAYIPAPLVFFRTHDESLSNTTGDLETYVGAQKDLMAEAVKVLDALHLQPDYDDNVIALIRWCLKDFCSVMRRSDSWNGPVCKDWISFQRDYIRQISRGRYSLMRNVIFQLVKLRWSFLNKRMHL